MTSRFISRKLVQRCYDKALAIGLKGYAKLYVFPLETFKHSHTLVVIEIIDYRRNHFIFILFSMMIYLYMDLYYLGQCFLSYNFELFKWDKQCILCLSYEPTNINGDGTIGRSSKQSKI